ncbi:MAG: class I SAM-dependent methyltransferase [Sneathiellales bacterium]|nr:class I SAM-dependent methyltransferase [Sneathiellales bacterium]
MITITGEEDPYNHSSIERRTTFVVEFLKKAYQVSFEGKRVLDLGAGNGGPLFWILLEEHAEHVVAVDRAKTRTDLMQKSVDRLALNNFEVINGDFVDLQHYENSFDIVIGMQILANPSPLPREYFEKSMSILKPGGITFLNTRNFVAAQGSKIMSKGSQWLPFDMSWRAEHYYNNKVREMRHRFSSPGYLSEAMEKSGFVDIRWAGARATNWQKGTRARDAYLQNGIYIAGKRPL